MVTKNEIKEAYDFIANDYDDYMEKTNHANAQREIIEKAKRNARKAQVKVNFLVDGIEGSIFPDNKFDIVICCLGMLWFINKEMIRISTKDCCKNWKLYIL